MRDRLMDHYDVIIVGAGSMGMAAGYYLSKLGKRTLLLDSNDPPHSLGSHHGDTRIIRHAYGEGRKYVPLALRAQALWRELEQESGMDLFSPTGVLCVGAEGSLFIEEVVKSAKEFSLPLEILSSDEINVRWPGFKIPEGSVGCLEKNSGVLFSEECIRAYRRLGLANGMTLVPFTKVEKIEKFGEGAVVQTNSEQYAADYVVICSGAWTGKILEETGLDIPLQPTRKTVSWFECDDLLYDASHFPAFTIDLLNEHYYGFPNINGSGVKIGRHDGGEKVDPDCFNREYGVNSTDEDEARNFIKKYLPKANGPLIKGKTCLYTLTPDEHFIIDRHPSLSNVIIAAGFSGHGFKFASIVGKIICDLVTEGKTNDDISMFSLHRFSSECSSK
ncbi:N-methyl-L-tryptophan oxidase [Bacillus sp. ISL-7]|uniref:N-methyl-L-tryptophan oxidase n=1 Tax=Bacillus sp. ISL-7 TaxID=2819136 RepID=UPI002034EC1D|nr:N-methyl-L-tryptophan oxidase [Bacillus sp. ISL-7]